MLFRKTPIAFLLFITVKLAAQTHADRAEVALDALDAALGNIFLGSTKAAFLEVEKPAVRAENTEAREVYLEEIGRGGIEDISYFFEKKTGGQLLYEIVVGFSDEGLPGEAARRELGEPNFPGKKDIWVLSAEKSDLLVSLAWVVGNKFILAGNFKGSEWDGSERFRLPSDFDYDSLREFMVPAMPDVLEADPLAKAEFFDVLERQIEAAPDHFQKLRGPLLGEPGSGVVECNAPLNLGQAADISQDDDANWRLTNYVGSGLDQKGAVEFQRQLTDLLLKYPMKNFRLQPAGRATEDGIEETTFEVLTKKGKLTGIQVVITRGYFEEDWAVDLSVVKT